MPPTLINFTLRDNQFATASDSDDGGSDADVVSLIGPVKFIPQINRPALGTTLSPQAMLSLRPIDGYYDTDGQLKNKRGGSVGVRVPANDPVLGLSRLPYRVVFGPMTTPPGTVVSVPELTFDAPVTDVTVWLPSVGIVPGATAHGISKGDPGAPTFPVLVDDGPPALYQWQTADGVPVGDPQEIDVDLSTVELLAHKNQANGYAGLDGSSKISAAQLPISAMEYKGIWNATTNSPALADGAGNTGDLYRVGTAGTRNLGSGSIVFDVGDYVIYNGSTWEKSDTTDAIASVAGLTGVISASGLRAAASLAKRTTFLVDDYGTVDYTGATASDTAVAAAVTAMGTGPGTIEFAPTGVGIVRLNTPVLALLYADQSIEGNKVQIDYRGTGACIRAWDSLVPHDNNTWPARGGTIRRLYVNGSNNVNTNISGLHVGDWRGLVLDDVLVANFTTVGAKGIWAENQYSWLERSYFKTSVINCTDCYVFSANASHTSGINSFDYSQYWLSFIAYPNQNGITIRDNAAFAGVSMFVSGNCEAGGVSNTGVAFTVGVGGSDVSYIQGHLDLLCETELTGAAHKDMNVAATSYLDVDGKILFVDGTSPFVAGTATTTTVGVFGAVSCPSMGRNNLTLQVGGPGNSPSFVANGPDADLHIVFIPKGAGGLTQWAGSQTTAVLGLNGSQTDIHRNITTKGAGRAQHNGVNIPTISSTDPLTGKTIDGTLNTLSNVTGMLRPAQVATDGSETYTIVGGSVTQIAGTKVNPISSGYSPAVGDRILIMTAPASTGAGSQYNTTTNPANGIYVVTSNTTNLSLARAADLSGTVNPAGLSVYVENNGASWMQMVQTVYQPATATAFTYGTDQMGWASTGGVDMQPRSILFYSGWTDSGGQLAGWNGTGTTRVGPSANAGAQTLTLPAGSGTLALQAAVQPKTMTGTVATAAGTGAKTVTLDSPWASYTPVAGDWFLFTYTSGNTANGTIAVNGGAARTVRLGNSTIAATAHAVGAGGALLYRFDGTFMHLVGSQLNTNVDATATVSTIAQRTAQGNLLADAFLPSGTSTATSAGTLTLTNDSAQYQLLTGVTTHTVQLATTSITLGWPTVVDNASSGAVAVNSSAGNLVVSVPAGKTAMLFARQAAPTAAAHWGYVLSA